MNICSRYAILFPNAEDIGSHLSYNDTHLTVTGGEGVTLQSRWTWKGETSEGKKANISTRITWRPINVQEVKSSQATVITPTLSPGFNVYTKNHNSQRMVENPIYKSFHDKTFNIDDWMPSEYDVSFIKWDLNCSFDIRLGNNTLEIFQWGPLSPGKTVELTKQSFIERSEVGLLYLDTYDDEDTTLSGLRCTWDSTGLIEECQKTMLMYSPAHTSDNSTSPIWLDTPVGLHPKILIDLKNSVPQGNCEYFAYLQLPLDLFIDKFQTEPEFIFGEHDLEQPEYKLRDGNWGSESLFKLEAGKTNEIVLHSRYVEPLDKIDFKKVFFEAMTFRACDSGMDRVAKNPFYSKGLGYESFFTADTVFQHLNSTSIGLNIPRPDFSHYNSTRFVTLTCITISLIYLLVKIIRPKS